MMGVLYRVIQILTRETCETCPECGGFKRSVEYRCPDCQGER